MEYKRFNEMVVVRIDKGEEIVTSILELCEKEKITLGAVQGIGATNLVTLGLFETGSKEYHSEIFTGDFEIAPLVGNITTMEGKVYLHLHANISSPDMKTYAGHLNKAIVSATFEALIHVIDARITRVFDDKVGLNLLKF